MVGSIYGLANIAKGLSFKTSFGVDIRRMDDYDFIPKYDVSPSQKTAESTVSRGNINYLNWLWENILTYDKVFKGKHDLKVMAGYTLESFQAKEKEGKVAKRLSFPNLEEPSTRKLAVAR